MFLWWRYRDIDGIYGYVEYIVGSALSCVMNRSVITHAPHATNTYATLTKTNAR